MLKVKVIICRWCVGDEPFMVPAKYWRYVALHMERSHVFSPQDIAKFARTPMPGGEGDCWLWGSGRAAVKLLEEAVVELP